mmetsp:Transcript_33887/g.82170  ORF Transcript_33887/g.82170 Transcript_33887/m.82170 type:complete len:212 (-) Transcript_33887:848-1483(-)
MLYLFSRRGHFRTPGNANTMLGVILVAWSRSKLSATVFTSMNVPSTNKWFSQHSPLEEQALRGSRILWSGTIWLYPYTLHYTIGTRFGRDMDIARLWGQRCELFVFIQLGRIPTVVRKKYRRLVDSFSFLQKLIDLVLSCSQSSVLGNHEFAPLLFDLVLAGIECPQLDCWDPVRWRCRFTPIVRNDFDNTKGSHESFARFQIVEDHLFRV